MECEGVNIICLALAGFQLCYVLNMKINSQFRYKEWNFITR